MYGYGYPYPSEKHASGVTLLLDDYPADRAFSVRLLRTAYSGALVRIRRSSDNAEKDFYPDGSNELSMSSEDGAGTSLSTWISTDSGFVVTWYDQSGNAANATNATAGQQPRVVNAGTIVTENGKTAIDFRYAAILTKLVFTTLADTAPTSALIVGKHRSTTAMGVAVGFSTALAPYYSGVNAGGATDYANWGELDYGLWTGALTGGLASNIQHLYFGAEDSGNNHYAFIDDTDLGADTTGGSNLGTGYNQLGARSTGSDQWDGPMQEVVLWASDERTNRSGIQTDVNTHFSIY